MWLFPDTPSYSGGVPSESKARGCFYSWNLLKFPQPSYSTTAPPVTSPATPQRLAVEVVCPAFAEDSATKSDSAAKNAKVSEALPASNLVKGLPVVLAVPSGMTRYRFWFTPASSLIPDTRPAVCWPVVTDERGSGLVPPSILTVTPTWVRHGHAPIVAGALRATLVVEFE